MAWPLTLGKLIAELRSLPDDMPVALSIGSRRLRPTTIASYRGDYAQLALGFEPGEPMPAGELAELVGAALWRHFEGYKGGHYLARTSTEVWADNWGDASERAIVGVRRRRDGSADLVTKRDR